MWKETHSPILIHEKIHVVVFFRSKIQSEKIIELKKISYHFQVFVFDPVEFFLSDGPNIQ